jgi:two-component system, OmpR family, sensor kinase
MGVTALRTAGTIERRPPERDTASAAAGGQPGSEPPRRRLTLIPRSARARIAALFLALLVAAGVLSIVGTRLVLEVRVNERVDEALRQEIEEVQILMQQGLDPLTGEPFADLERALDVYFERNVPSIQEAHIAFVDGDLYRQRLRSFPARELPSAVLSSWASFTDDGVDLVAGEFDTVEGRARFRAVDIDVAGERGIFVVAILPEAEMREIRELQTYGAGVVVVVVVLAGACAWKLSGRILEPVRELTETARSISETDRMGRVSVTGGVEAAQMARHFNAMLDRLDAVHYSQLAFVEAVGHELRTPLTVATGHLELLEDDNPERQRTVELVLGELTRMARLVDDLQTLAESERDDYVLRGDIDGSAFARELLAKAMVLGDRNWQLDATSAGPFRGDQERLTEAALNLVDNAVKHTEVGGDIEIGVAVNDGGASIWVRDSGPGVDHEAADELFERFVRGDAARRRYRGSGLGLAIARSIGRAHGGDVVLTSTPTGASFTIVVPHEATR